MFKSNSKILILAAAAVIVLIVIIVLTLPKHQSQPTSVPNGFTKKLPSSSPPSEAITVVQKYVQARENAVGSDQTSPNAWLNTVKPISTTSWFASLQPQSGSTGSTPADYNTAHFYGYKVKAELSNCIWDFKLTLPTAVKGTMYCELVDTVTTTSGNAVANSDLPFGWTHSGQGSVTIALVKTGGQWLVNQDLSGND